MTKSSRFSVALSLSAAMVVGGVALLKSGLYGWTIFVAFPVILGALSTWVWRPATAARAAGFGALAVAMATVLLLMTGWEGVFCVVMCLPLSAPLGAVGGMFAYFAMTSKTAARGLTMLLVMPPATIGWDLNAKPPIFAVRTQIEVKATPERVWKHVVTFSELPAPTEWFFHAGLAYPQRARIVGSGPGAVRYCEFSTGPFVEPIEVWDEPRLLSFRVTENPAPMHELSFYSSVLPKHLHGYLVSKHGQFRLTRLANGGTLLEGTTWYQHGLWPAQYWRWWSDAIIHRIHLRVLNHVRTLAEQESSAQW